MVQVILLVLLTNCTCICSETCVQYNLQFVVFEGCFWGGSLSLSTTSMSWHFQVLQLHKADVD